MLLSPSQGLSSLTPCTCLFQPFSFSFPQPCCFKGIIFTRNKFYSVVLTVKLFFKFLWLLTVDQSQSLLMRVPAQQDANINALWYPSGEQPFAELPRARWSGDLALSLNVSETLKPVTHPLGKDSQMTVINIHFQSNLAIPSGS